MVGTSPLDALPIWATFVLTALLVIGATELGHRVGIRRRAGRAETDDRAGGVMVGAALAMLAFLLAFLVGMATDRYDGRRGMVMEEANAIGTTWLRAGYLPDDAGATIRPILEDYTAQRLRLPDDAQREDALAQSAALVDRLWAATETVARAHGDSPTVALFVQSVNETIDIGSKRSVAMATWRIAPTIWASVYAVAILTMLFVGFHTGLTGSRNRMAVVLLSLSFAAVMNLIIDLDRPYAGLLRVSSEALVQLQSTFPR